MLRSVLLATVVLASAGSAAAGGPGAPTALGPAAPPPPPPHHAPVPPPADVPPHARPGECYARLAIPARIETYREQVLVEPERVERRTVPPVFRPVEHDQVVREGYTRVEHVPPVFETVPERVVVRPGYEQTVVEPAKLGTVNETVQVAPPRLVWKLTRSPLQPAPVWCLVPEGPVTKVVQRTVILEPERTRVVATPPEYATVPKQVLRRPGETREVVVPPEVKRVVVNELVEPARVEETRIPPRFADVEKTRVVEPERTEWTRVLCDTGATAHKIKALQQALGRRGYYRGRVDGIYGRETAEAVARFQADQGIPHAGYLSLPTLERLGVAMG